MFSGCYGWSKQSLSPPLVLFSSLLTSGTSVPHSRASEPTSVLNRADATTSAQSLNPPGPRLPHRAFVVTADFGRTTAAVVAGLDMMPGQIPDPSLAAGSLPSLGPLAGISATTLTDQLKLADFHQLGSMLSPLHFLGRLGKRPLAIKTERDEDEERRKRRREKNKVAAARCRNKKKERTDFLQRESERLEMVNSELKAQIEELRLERQQLMVMLNLHRPTCIVRTDSVKTPENEANPLLEQLSSETK